MQHTTIDDSVALGEGVRVWQYASVIRGSVVGYGSVIGPCALIDGTTTGRDCRVGHSASLNPGTRLGSEVFIGPHAVTCNDRWPEVSKEGYKSFLDGEAAVIICDRASIGAGAIIMPGVVVGEGAVVAAGAVVTRNLPAGQVLYRDGRMEPVPADRRQRR